MVILRVWDYYENYLLQDLANMVHNKSELLLVWLPCRYYYSMSSTEDTACCLATQGRSQKSTQAGLASWAMLSSEPVLFLLKV